MCKQIYNCCTNNNDPTARCTEKVGLDDLRNDEFCTKAQNKVQTGKVPLADMWGACGKPNFQPYLGKHGRVCLVCGRNAKLRSRSADVELVKAGAQKESVGNCPYEPKGDDVISRMARAYYHTGWYWFPEEYDT
jgi:hypothetical protein